MAFAVTEAAVFLDFRRDAVNATYRLPLEGKLSPPFGGD